MLTAIRSCRPRSTSAAHAVPRDWRPGAPAPPGCPCSSGRRRGSHSASDGGCRCRSHYCCGFGSCCGSGFGSGFGFGCGCGCGSGSGSGPGCGSGSGLSLAKQACTLRVEQRPPRLRDSGTGSRACITSYQCCCSPLSIPKKPRTQPPRRRALSSGSSPSASMCSGVAISTSWARTSSPRRSLHRATRCGAPPSSATPASTVQRANSSPIAVGSCVTTVLSRWTSVRPCIGPILHGR